MSQQQLFTPPKARPRKTVKRQQRSGFGPAVLLEVFRERLPVTERDRAASLLAERIGITDVQVRRRITSGSALDRHEADKWATRAGLYPGHVWPKWGGR